MHILIATSGFPTPARPALEGGSAAVAEAVARHLKKSGHQVTVLRVGHGNLPTETAYGIDVISISKPNIYRWREGRQRGTLSKLLWHAIEDRREVPISVSSLLQDKSPDLIATHNIMGLGTQIWGAAEREGIPCIHTLHDYYLICPRTTRFRGGRNCDVSCSSCKLLTSRRRAATKQLAGVISVSRHVLDVHLANGLFEHIPQHVILNAATFSGHRVLPVSGPGELRIGFIGRGTTQKGLPVLLRSFEDMAMSNSRLVVAGRVHPEASNYAASLRRRSEVDWLGQVLRDDFYSRVDVVVVPSLHSEPFSLVVAEAQSYGLPVIASKVGGIPEAMGSERAGWLLDPGDTRKLRDILDTIAANRDLLTEKRQYAFARAQEKTPMDTWKSYERVYGDAVARAAKF